MQNEEISKKYLSLKEAVEYCDYSQEYLSLRARQGKLKAMKFGRNWVTTKDWIDEYKIVVTEYNNKQMEGGYEQKVFQPPYNLPISEASSKENQGDYKTELLSSNKAKSINLRAKIRFGLVFIFTTSSLIASVAFEQEPIKSAYLQLDSFTQPISQRFDKKVIEKTLEIADITFPYIYRLREVQVPDMAESIKYHTEAYIIRTQEQILRHYNAGAAIFFK